MAKREINMDRFIRAAAEEFSFRTGVPVRMFLPGVIQNVNCRCVIHNADPFDPNFGLAEPEQLELNLVQSGTWDEILSVTNWQPGRNENEM